MLSTRILVVCKGNTCRSPMFAAVLARTAKKVGIDLEVESAGCLETAKNGNPAAPEWTVIRGETGIDLSAHKSRWIGDLNLGKYDLVIAMEPEAMHAALEQGGIPATRVILANPEEGGIPNPWTKGQEAYNECYKTIARVINAAALELVT